MTHQADTLRRCYRCSFMIQPGEPRLVDDHGYLHPTCLADGEVIDQ